MLLDGKRRQTATSGRRGAHAPILYRDGVHGPIARIAERWRHLGRHCGHMLRGERAVDWRGQSLGSERLALGGEHHLLSRGRERVNGDGSADGSASSQRCAGRIGAE